MITMSASSIQISQDELLSFFASHFSDNAVSKFGQNFLNPTSAHISDVPTGHEAYEEDELGYYDDGVKRTLTDEQIEIFRHSELEALRRESERRPKRPRQQSLDQTSDAGSGQEPPFNGQSSAASQLRKKKAKRRNTGKGAKPEPKPDLRKRTWDVVEAGVDTLEYD
jgi:hypothetical protein